VLSSRFRYLAADACARPLYCQVRECDAPRPGAAPRTRLKDMGSMCARACDATPCAADELRLACSLPHDTRCVHTPGAPRADVARRAPRTREPARAR